MLKIAIVGPESTGKSVLSKELANHYKGLFVPEYARTYVENLGRNYTFDDVCAIARKQVEEQNVYSKELRPVFFDTEMIITRVWLEYCYGVVPDFVLENINSGYFDLYLLCFPDLDWIPDPVREHGGDERMYFFDWYRREIEQTAKPCFVVKGQGDDRTKCAIAVIDQFMKENSLRNG